MALKDCPECGHKVSESALSCPQCGHPLYMSLLALDVRRVSVIFAIGALILFGILFWIRLQSSAIFLDGPRGSIPSICTTELSALF